MVLVIAPHGHDPTHPWCWANVTESPPPAVSLAQRRRAADLALIAAGASHRVALDAAAADATAAAAAASTLSHPSRSPPAARSSAAVVASTSTLPTLPLPPGSCDPAHAVRRHNTAAGAPADLLTEAAGAPLLLPGAADSWPAVQRWADPAYLCTVAGPHVVPVELGSTYLADGERAHPGSRTPPTRNQAVGSQVDWRFCLVIWCVVRTCTRRHGCSFPSG
jgi:hypothetical protein